MKNECKIVEDLLPLYVEKMVSAQTSDFIKEHLEKCPMCRSELEGLSDTHELEKIKTEGTDDINRFQKTMKRMSRRFYMLTYSLIIVFIFLGFSFTGGENLMYNSLIMPAVGIFGYCVFRGSALYKVPIILLMIDLFLFIFGLVELDLLETVLWTFIYCIFVYVGIAIAFLLHFAFKKEKNNE